jgi:hypothetical protein
MKVTKLTAYNILPYDDSYSTFVGKDGKLHYFIEVHDRKDTKYYEIYVTIITDKEFKDYKNLKLKEYFNTDAQEVLRIQVLKSQPYITDMLDIVITKLLGNIEIYGSNTTPFSA